MTNCWPSASLRAVATARVRMSVLMPGGNGQITVTGRVGHGSAASAGVVARIQAVTIQTAARLTKLGSIPAASSANLPPDRAILQDAKHLVWFAGHIFVVSFSLTGQRPSMR